MNNETFRQQAALKIYSNFLKQSVYTTPHQAGLLADKAIDFADILIKKLNEK